ncbi:HlyD family efflux transporter periplasmic adaptor subunit [Sphingomonas sp. ASV193]|uniref:HlyD family secretion protein n=1 Tax=Sphingomonas sp. ASV193 TaxID=3144405 RepID=UPI0032E87EAB
MSTTAEHAPAADADTPAPDQEAPADKQPVVDPSKRKSLLIRLAIVVVLVGIAWFAYSSIVGARSVSTDNAYVNGQNAMVTPLTNGQVIAVPVVETQMVRKGQLLLQLDDQDQKLAVAKAEADLAAAQRQFLAIRAQGDAQSKQAAAQGAAVGQARAQYDAAASDLAKARADYSRRASLRGTGAVSADELTAAATAVQTASARLQQLSAAVAQQEKQREAASSSQAATLAPIHGSSIDSSPAVLQARAALDNARLDLARTQVRAPVDGVVAQLKVQVGQMLPRGATAMMIVPVGQLYVDANFKENQLAKVRVGQPVELTSDYYGGDVVFHGRVVGISGGTGAAFSPIPAQNASGNWIKVIQRLPVRISLDPKELAAHPLRVGLTMDAKVDITGGK